MEYSLIDENIRKAYERYNNLKDSQVDSLALATLNDFHNLINQWGGSRERLQGISFYKNYLTGTHMNAIAAKGAAAIRIENFEYIMSRVGTAKKIADLFCLRRDYELREGLVNQIAEIDFTNFVFNHPSLEGPNPILYTNRFLLSIFIEIMTTIADANHLKQTAIALGMQPNGVRFERLQVQIRCIVESSLIRQNLGGELTKFTRASLAYHIKDV